MAYMPSMRLWKLHVQLLLYAMAEPCPVKKEGQAWESDQMFDSSDMCSLYMIAWIVAPIASNIVHRCERITEGHLLQ